MFCLLTYKNKGVLYKHKDTEKVRGDTPTGKNKMENKQLDKYTIQVIMQELENSIETLLEELKETQLYGNSKLFNQIYTEIKHYLRIYDNLINLSNLTK